MLKYPFIPTNNKKFVHCVQNIRLLGNHNDKSNRLIIYRYKRLILAALSLNALLISYASEKDGWSEKMDMQSPKAFSK